MSTAPRVIAILGCTASGKSALALRLAERLGGEILSIDSMQVYRGLDIGTAKPTPDERRRAPHHLIDVADPWESFDAARFVAAADEAVVDVVQRGRPIIAVGGTVFYFKAFYEGLFAGPSADPAIRAEIRQRAAALGPNALHAELARVDPATAARLHPNDIRRVERALEVHALTGRPISDLQTQWDRGQRRRPDWRWLLIGLEVDKETLSRRINARVRSMVAAGLFDEARRLFDDPRGVSQQAGQAVGYAEIFAHFRGEWTRDDAIEQVKINTRRLAKHQRTWLRRFAEIQWLPAADTPLDDLVEQAFTRVSAAGLT